MSQHSHSPQASEGHRHPQQVPASLTPNELRKRIRKGEHTGATSGLAPGFVQCNLVILTRDWADDFLRFCQLNPRPCPLIACSDGPGSPHLPKLGDVDLRHDLPAYRVFRNGDLREETTDIAELWQDDLVAFALGCSFSFEEALQSAGLEIRNITEGVNVPMYRTNLACDRAGRFESDMVVSMRPFSAKDAIRAIQVCTRFPAVHGAPLHFGNPLEIGIENLAKPDFGDPVTLHPNEVPLFWACGVTPQLAIARAAPPLAITHSPGCMLVTDLPNATMAVF